MGAAHPWVREGGDASDMPLDISVLSNMREFVKYSRLKQLALRVLLNCQFNFGFWNSESFFHADKHQKSFAVCWEVCLNFLMVQSSLYILLVDWLAGIGKHSGSRGDSWSAGSIWCDGCWQKWHYHLRRNKTCMLLASRLLYFTKFWWLHEVVVWLSVFWIGIYSSFGLVMDGPGFAKG